MIMGKWRHRLSNINVVQLTGDCSNCGVVKLKKKSNNMGFWCSKSQRRWSRRCGVIYDEVPVQPCKICGHTKPLKYDHDHATGVFRGWICNNCNLMLGNAFDSIETLENAIVYLKR